MELLNFSQCLDYQHSSLMLVAYFSHYHDLICIRLILSNYALKTKKCFIDDHFAFIENRE